MQTRLTFLCFLFHCLILNSFAQEKVKFGKPLMEDLTMTVYSPDSSAQAVILFDKGFFGSTNFSFSRHVRLKVLKSAGAYYANFTIRTPSKGNIDGFTYNLENGKLVTSKLEKSNIFNERIIDDFEVYKVFFPNVKEGSVIDLKYFHNGLPMEWRFQDRIPVVYNEITLEPTEYVKYKKIMYGFAKVEQESNVKWVARNVPAIIEEPLMSHYSNYVTKFKIDLQQIAAPNYYREFSTTWEKVGERMMEYNDFGGVIRESFFLNEKAREIKMSTEPLLVKLQMAIDFIKENIKWNGESAVYASGGYRENFKKNHTGNSADINLLLIALLKKSDIKVYPMILSTRSNGLLNPGIASISSPNYVAGYVRDSGVELLMDATSLYSVPGFIPVQCRNLSGWIITDKVAGEWVDLSGGMSSVKRQFISIAVDSTDQYYADISEMFENYEFFDWMRAYDAAGSDEAYVRSVSSGDYELEKCTISMVNKTKLKAAVRKSINLSITEHIQDLGNEILVNPFILTDISNPFKSETRSFPIDFVSPRLRSTIISFKIPKNHSLRRVPDNLLMSLENGGVKFSYRAALEQDILTIKCDLLIEKQMFSENEYSAMRNFFMSVNRKMSEVLQLDKKT